MTDKPKITNIADARSRATANKKVSRAGASSSGKNGYDRALLKQKGVKGLFAAGAGGIRWYHYIQLLLFLFLVTWLMRSCTI